MESQYARRLRSGKEFDPLFPRPDGKDHEVKRQANVGDTVHFIQEQAPKNTWQTKAIAQYLQRRTLEDTCRAVWNFVYQHIQYEKDEDGIEQVRSPRRVWWERKGDCDCFSSLISSILLSMEPPIPHTYRITKYYNRDASKIRWQHIYPIVPKNGRLDGVLDRRSDYIVLDCVKDAYNDEQPYYEKKDFKCIMKLEYLDGLEGEEEMGETEVEYVIPPNVDAMDLAALYDEEQLGKAGFVKKVAKKVKAKAKKVGQAVKKTVGKGIRFINRVANPATILLRNGFLLAMKTNILKIASRLKHAYLTDAQAKAKGMDMGAFKKLKNVLAKAEKIYTGAGGKKENLRLAILKGKGNKHKDVPLKPDPAVPASPATQEALVAGLEGIYADQQEYDIVHSNSITGLGELGEPASAATIAAAMAALTAISAALKSVKGLFPKGSKEGKEFEDTGGNSGGGGSGSTSDAPPEEPAYEQPQKYSISATSNTITKELVPTSNTENTTDQTNELPMVPAKEQKQVADPPAVSSSGSAPVTTESSSTTANEPKSLMKDPVGWAKENPGKAALGALGIAGLIYVGVKAMSGEKKGGGLSGIDSSPKKKRRGKRKKTTQKKSVIKAIKIL